MFVVVRDFFTLARGGSMSQDARALPRKTNLNFQKLNEKKALASSTLNIDSFEYCKFYTAIRA